MKLYTADNLIIHPCLSDDPDLIVNVSPEQAGWETIHFQARRLAGGLSWSFKTVDNEMALVMLGGQADIQSNRGNWAQVGERENVFTGLPHALYLPPGTSFIFTARTDCEFVAAWVNCSTASHSYPPRLVTPQEVVTEIRGGDHATRQINRILPPGFPCARLVVVEVYTPGGNWSSYPPHKHDIHKTAPDGSLLEADLDEIYYYKFDRPEGFAIQKIYTDLESPLQQAGHPIDCAVIARNNDVVLIPEGYHPVSSPVGYTTYYLNVLAGSAQSLAASDDPQFAWVKASYRSRDPRLPIYPVQKIVE